MNLINNLDWILARWKDKSPLDNGPYIQAFAVVKSLLDSSTHFIIKCGFTPILPYPAAECIFLGIGGLHLEKVVNGCLGAYFETSVIHNLLVEKKICGSAVVNSVISGRNYIWG